MNSVSDDRPLLDRLVRRYPPRHFRVDDYVRWFPKTGDAMLRYLKLFAPLPVATDGRLRQPDASPVGVVVGPWFSTPVPWYSIMLGIGLARRGRNVVFLWDDSGFPQAKLDVQQRVIGEVLSAVERAMPVVRLTDADPAAVQPGAADLVEALTDQNVTWTLRGAAPTEHDRPRVDAIRSALTRAHPLVRSALAEGGFDWVLIPGGVCSTSGLFIDAARELGCRSATFDVDRGIAQICVSGVAAQNGDIARAFETVWSAGDDTRSQAITGARTEFVRRTESNDRYGFQIVPSSVDVDSDADAIAAVIPMNVEWDAAALGRHLHFDDTVDWITSTVKEILNEDAGTVVVRQHPSERRALQRSRLDISAVLHDRFGDDSRVRFVAADDPANTYDLLHSAKLVLPFVSTIGIEAAAMGKPVLLSGASYYADLGFVWSASSRDEYFALLRRGLRGDLPLLPDQIDRAWMCFYLTAVRNRVWTDFTPAQDDFWKWCRRAPDSLFAEPEVSDILEALDRDVPVSLLRHRRLSIGQAA